MPQLPGRQGSATGFDSRSGFTSISTRTVMRHLEDLIRQFIEMQAGLLEALRRDLGERDWTYLLDLPWRGRVEWKGQSWDYTRHGQGIRFRRNRIDVDANRNISFDRDVIDAGRIWEFAESRGEEQLVWAGGMLPVDLGPIDRALESMCEAGQLERIPGGTGRIYFVTPALGGRKHQCRPSTDAVPEESSRGSQP